MEQPYRRNVGPEPVAVMRIVLPEFVENARFYEDQILK